ncbi:tetratricopeptide repeat protein [Streptomyces sp. NPDC056670]|uniref:tetratricopeptide repeat protein n=1 Tax=Streptomyces sp. NPDC056670 TaxID=3345904 RepID=UPI0036970FEE
MGRFSPRTQHHVDQSAAASKDGDYKEAYRQFKAAVAEDPENAVAALAGAHLANRNNRR